MGITLVLTTAVLGVVLDVIALTCNIIVPCDIKSISPKKFGGELALKEVQWQLAKLR